MFHLAWSRASPACTLLHADSGGSREQRIMVLLRLFFFLDN